MKDPRYAHFPGAKMNRYATIRPLPHTLSVLRKVRSRTWLIVAGVVFAVMGLLIWAGVALLGWLLGLAPVVTDTGKRFVGEAARQIEQVQPGVTEKIEQAVPDVRAKLEQLVPGLGLGMPASEVTGIDPGPVARFPGLVRSSFVRGETSTEVRYSGQASFDAVRGHYLEGFAAAGFTTEVMSASANSERYTAVRNEVKIDLVVLRKLLGAVEVQLIVPRVE